MNTADERETHLHELIAGYLDLEAAGRAPERERWLAEHREFADDLRQFLDEHERLGRVSEPLRHLAAPRSLAEAATLDGAVRDTLVQAPTPRRLFGDYELLDEIARGGMGVVYKARQKSLNRLVALKMILAGQLATATDVQRFRSEAEAAAGLDHPNIVPIYDVDAFEGQHYFSMKLVEGDDLARAIAADRWPRHTAAGQRAIATLMAQAARAVQYAHQRGILHRDLKPANILLSARQEPVLTDFGLAKRVGHEAAVTQTGAVVGTPSYMPPEQASGTKQLTTAADVYSLGAILYEMLTGRPPFIGDSALSILTQVGSDEPAPPGTVNPTVERDLATICLTCLEKEPSRRYASAAALADDLEAWLAGTPIQARPATNWERTVKWAKRRPAIAALAAACAVLAIVLLLGGLIFNANLQVALAQVGEQKKNLETSKETLGRSQSELKQALEAVGVQENQVALAKSQAQQRLTEAESLRLVAQSEVVRATDPALALLLAIEAARVGPRRAEQNNALASAVAACRETGPLLRADDGHDVRMVRWFSDGSRVVTISWGTVRIWDVKTGRKLVEFEGPHLRIRSAALSPDDQWLALTYEEYYEHSHVQIGAKQSKGFLVTDQVARVYQAATGAEAHILRGHHHRVESVAFSPDSKRIVTASADRTARIWDAATGKELRSLEGHECGLAMAEFVADGRVLTVSTGRRRKDNTNPLQHVIEKWPAGLVDPPLPPSFRTMSGGASATGSGGFGQGEKLFACFWDADTGAKLTEFHTTRRFFEFPDTAIASGDGKHLLAPHYLKPSLWDGTTGKEVHVFTHSVQDRNRERACFSGDGKRVALVVAARNVVRIFDVATRQETAVLRGHGDEVFSVRFSPDPEGRRVLTASADQTARVWDAATGAELLALRGHEQAVRAAEFDRNGERVLTGSDDGTARFWNVGASMEYGRVLDEDARTFWSRDGTEQLGKPYSHKHAIWSASLSPDGQRVALGYFDGTLRMQDVRSGKVLAEQRGLEKLKNAKLRDQLLREIFSVAWSRDGARLLTIASDKIGIMAPDGKVDADMKNVERLPYQPVHIHDGVTGTELAALGGHPQGVRYAHFSPDGSRVLTVAEHRAPARITVDQAFRPRSTGGGGEVKDQTARIFDAKSGQQLHVFAGDWKHILSACWDAKGERVCTVHENIFFQPNGRMADLPPIRIWDVKTGVETHRLSDPRNGVNSAAFSPDGRRLLTWFDSCIREPGSSGHTRTARVWNLASSKILFTLQDATVGFATYSPDGRWIATTAFAANGSTSSATFGHHGRLRDTNDVDRTVRLWDAETGALVATLYGHTQSAYFAAFSPDNRRLVTCSEDRTARVWDVATGKEFITLRGHGDEVKTAQFSGDGESVLTVAWDGSARLWPIDPLPLALSRKSRELTAEERGRFEIKKTGE